MSAPETVPSHLLVVEALSAAGFDAADVRYAPLSSGTDSLPFAATTRDGHQLVVKIRRTGSRSRYPTASWTSARMREAGIPAAEVLWHSQQASVETRCPGRPIETAPPTPQDLDAATRAGEVLRRLHTIEVTGFGQLDGHGIGHLATVEDWFLSIPSPSIATTDDLELLVLLHRARSMLGARSGRLAYSGPRLLHGDCVARHLFTDGRQITGVVDLESARGGDPLAEIAGWSLREPAPTTEALLAGYLDDSLPADRLLDLILFRLRIAYSLLHVHASRDEPDMIQLRADQLQADLDDLEDGHLAALPRITPDATSSASRRP